MRYRISFHKTHAMRYTGHLDLHTTWERAFRRAGLPLAYSQGFHPQPRLNLACALPLGFTSEAELLDVWLEQELEPETVKTKLAPVLPPGIWLHTVTAVMTKEPALQVQVQSAVYVITLLESVESLDQAIAALMAATELPRVRRGKTYDLRPLIESLIRLPDNPEGWPRLQVRLAARDSATGRPEELLDALGLPVHAARIHRTRLILIDQTGYGEE